MDAFTPVIFYSLFPENFLSSFVDFVDFVEFVDIALWS